MQHEPRPAVPEVDVREMSTVWLVGWLKLGPCETEIGRALDEAAIGELRRRGEAVRLPRWCQ